MSIQRRITGVLLSSATLCLAANASAQARTFYLDRIQISGAPDDGYTVWRPTNFEEQRFYLNAALGYTMNPLRADVVVPSNTAGDPAPVVEGQLITYLSAGTELWGYGSVNISLPIALYQWGSDDTTVLTYGTVDVGDTAPSLKDVRLDGRLTAYENEAETFRFGLAGAVWLPTGGDSSYSGDRQPTAYGHLAIEQDFDSFFIAGQVGPQFRPERSLGGSQNQLYLASEARWALGAYVPFRDNRIRLGLELWGTTGIEKVHERSGSNTMVSSAFSKENTDLEWLFQARFLFRKERDVFVNAGAGTRLASGYGSPDIRVLASVGYWFQISDEEPDAPSRKIEIVSSSKDYAKDTDGDGFPDDVDKCPTIKEDGREPEPADGCPFGADRDGDGIPDADDACPDDPEDKDGIQDEDGCPEKDADNDQIPDVEDKCPLEPGPRSQIAEKNGCPSLTRFEEGSEIQLLQPIQFDTAKATIKPVSFPILDEVVALLKARPDVKIAVYGHTDSVGSDASNLKLSKDRAASCMKYLVDHGIPKTRLESEGFGETKPLETNETAEGRAINRRVEFKVVD